jgi:hypothetical protein
MIQAVENAHGRIFGELQQFGNFRVDARAPIQHTNGVRNASSLIGISDLDLLVAHRALLLPAVVHVESCLDSSFPRGGS